MDILHYLTTHNQANVLRVDLMMPNGTQGYATFQNFKVGAESTSFQLTFGAYLGGTAGI